MNHFGLELNQMYVNASYEYMVCKHKKSIYGVKKASRKWYLKLNDTIMVFRFKENIVDRCIYLKASENNVIVLFLYVDDIFLATNNLGLLYKTEKFLSNKFKMKDMGEACHRKYL